MWSLDEVLHIELDGFGYADAYEGGRFVGLTLTKPAEVRTSGLIVDPKVARAQIDADTAASAAARAGTGDEATDSDPDTAGDSTPAGDGAKGPGRVDREGGATVPAKVPTRFHATKELTSSRVVRDVSGIYEEILSHFVSAGVAVKVTLDVESDELDRLTNDQRVAIQENLKALRFGDDDWSMD